MMQLFDCARVSHKALPEFEVIEASIVDGVVVRLIVQDEGKAVVLLMSPGRSKAISSGINEKKFKAFYPELLHDGLITQTFQPRTHARPEVHAKQT
jgi:hypothetical protein